MYKNQLQELAQRSCFNLPSYACIREGPDHAPRFKATVNFNGEVFESPNYCSTLRQAEHSAAEVALNVLSTRGPARSLAARVLDETGVYKNLLQETTHRAGLSLPAYTTVRSGPGHLPVFTCTVDIAGIIFTGEPAKTKKQAEKNAAMAAWSALRHFAQSSGSSSFTAWDAEGSEEKDHEQEQEQITIARFLSNLVGKDGESSGNHHHFYQQQQRRRILQSQRERNSKNALVSIQGPRFLSQQQQQQQSRILTLPTLPPPPPAPAPTGSKLLPFIRSIFPLKAQQSQQHDTVIPSPSQSSQPRVTSNVSTLATYPNKPTTPRVMQVQVKTRLGTPTPQEVSIPFEEHQRDEDEWLNGASASSTRDSETRGNNSSWHWANAFTAFGSGNICTPSYPMQTPQNFNIPSTVKSNSTVIHPTANTYGGSGSSSVCLRTPASSLASPVRIRSTVPVCSAPPPRRMITHDVSNDPNFVAPSHLSAAPAVCVRSVIPVCSAPTVPPGFSSRDHEAESSHRGQTDVNDETDDQSDETRSRMLLNRLHL